jgi:hypothetical protein
MIMNIKTKKVIAREFLALLLVIGIGLTTFCSISIHNAICNKKIDKMKIEIDTSFKEMNILLFAHNEKLNNQNRLFRKYNDITRFDGNTSKKFWQRLDEIAQRDSISHKWDNIWSEELRIFFKNNGFQNKQELEVFIAKNRITEKEKSDAVKAGEKRAYINDLKEEIIVTTKSRFSFEEQISKTSYILILSIICVFSLRYLVYGLKWSLKVLNQRDE